MQLTNAQIDQYKKYGYLLVPDLFESTEVEAMLENMQKVVAEDCPRRILEKSGKLRSFFAPEQSSEFFGGVIRDERLVLTSRQLINDEVYIHQTKLNTKHAIVGDWWDWHQDYTFWKKDDGMPNPDVLTAMIFLDDVTEFNGPLFLIPGSHRAGTVDSSERDRKTENDEWFADYQNSTSYMSALTADLKYTLGQRTISEWVAENGIVSAKGKAGTVLFFHGNLFHASPNNLSPWHRNTFLVTYNGVKNKLGAIPNPRPEFIASRNFSAVQAQKRSTADLVAP